MAADLLPVSTLAGFPVKAGAGSNGEEVNEYTMVGALNVFADKTIPVSIIGNGCSAEAETPMFQQAMLELADTRKDLMVFFQYGYTLLLSAKIADRNSHLQQVNRNFTQKEALKTNHRDVKLAVMQEKIRFVASVNTSHLYVQNVAKRQKFHLNQEKTDLFFAANASLRKKANN